MDIPANIPCRLCGGVLKETLGKKLKKEYAKEIFKDAINQMRFYSCSNCNRVFAIIERGPFLMAVQLRDELIESAGAPPSLAEWIEIPASEEQKQDYVRGRGWKKIGLEKKPLGYAQPEITVETKRLYTLEECYLFQINLDNAKKNFRL